MGAAVFQVSVILWTDAVKTIFKPKRLSEEQAAEQVHQVCSAATQRNELKTRYSR